MNARFVLAIRAFVLSSISILTAEPSEAVDRFRANSSGALNNTARWVNGGTLGLPGPSDIAIWDATISTVANCTNNIGADSSWLGVKVTNPSANAQIGNTTGTTLWLGAGGINVADAATTRDLIILPNMNITNSMDINVKAGRVFAYARQFDIIDNITITMTNAGTFMGNNGNNCIIRIGAGSTGTATFNQSAGTNLCNQMGGVVVLHIGKATGNPGIYNLTGGVLDTDDVAGSTIGMGDVLGAEGTFNVSGGLVLATTMHVGRSGIGTLNLNGGAVTSTGNINMPNAATGTGTLNLNGGTLTVPQITEVAGVGTLNLHGGLLTLNASQGDFLHNLTINVKEGGARINTGGFDATVLQPFLHGGVASIDGGLIKSGAGTLTLSAADTYTGTNLVSDGKLVFSTAHTGTGSITASDGTGLGVTVSGVGTSLSTSALKLGNVTGATNEFNLGVFGNPVVPVLNATNLETHGVVVVNVTGVGLTVGQFPLIKYSGAIAGSGYAAFAIGILPPGVSANLVDNTGNSSVDLNVTVAPLLRWTAAQTADWDINTTTNWVDDSTSTPVAYTDGFPVLFADGAASGSVNITTSVSPGGTTVSNSSLAYSFSGGGSLATGTLRKEGTGSLTLAAGQLHTGDTTINGGSIVYGVLEALPSGAGKGNVIVNGTLDLNGFSGNINGLSGNGIVESITGLSTLTVGNNNANSTFSGTLQNSGGTLALTKLGSGVLLLSGNNTHAGDTLLGGGVAQVGNNNAFGASLVRLNSGTLSSGSAAAHTIANTVVIGANVTLGNAINNGTLTFSGPMSFIGVTRTLTVNSDAVFTGDLSDGGLNKAGPANLTLKGTVNMTQECEARVGLLILDGAIVTSALAFRVDASQLNGNPRMILTNGASLVLNAASANLRAGFDGTDTSTNYLDIAGMVRMPGADAANGKVALGAAVRRGVLTLQSGGDLEVSSVVPADQNIIVGGSASEFNFDGGILRPKVATTSFMQGLTEAWVRNGGAIFDTSGMDITVAQQLRAGGSGGLTKDGTGTLTLTGTNTYTGTTVVNGGRLVMQSTHAGGGAITVTSGTLQVKPVTASASLNASTATLNSGTSVEFNLGAFGNPSAPVLNVTTLTPASTVTLHVSGAGLVVGQFPLIKYTGAIGGSGFSAFAIGTLPLGVTANLVNNTGNSSVDLNITAVAPVLWTGVNLGGEWDINATPNWTVGAGPVTYQEVAIPGPNVRFDDSLTGTPAVNVLTIVSPASVTISNNSAAYSFVGGGIISGPASLTKQGSGSATMGTLNDYSGATTVSAGTLALSLSDVIPQGTGKGNVTVNGTLDLAQFNDAINGLSGNGIVTATVGPSTLSVGGNNSSSLFSGAFANSGSGVLSVTKSNSGTLTLTGTSTHSGGTTIFGGAVQMGSANALSSSQVTLSGGNLSSDSTTPRTLTNAMLITTASSLGNATNTGVLTLSGPINHNAAARITTYNSDVTLSGTLGNGSQHKEGTGTATLTGIADFTAEGEVRRGTWMINGGILTNTGAFRPDTTLSPGFARIVVTNGGAIILTGTAVNGRVGYTGGDNTSTNVLDLAGLYRMPNADSGNGITTVGRSGNRGILNFYPGGDLQTRQLLKGTTGTGQYGEVNFNGGILRAMNDQAAFITGLDLVTIRSGGVTIDSDVWTISVPQSLLTGGGSGGLTKIGSGKLFLNGNNTYTGTTLASAGTLGGNGIIAGPVSIASGATLSPGTSVGHLTVNNSLTLSSGSTTFIELDKGAGTNDTVTGVTTITYGGTLVLTNLSGTLAVNDTFQVFSANSYAGSFAAVTPAPGPGLSWNTSQLTVNGSLSVQAGGVNQTPTNITAVVIGNALDLTWPADYIGWRLEAQTNSLTVGLSNIWTTVPGSDTTNHVIFPINPSNPSVFFRMVYP